jgi:polyphosphate kinase 2 (PPK2 family)
MLHISPEEQHQRLLDRLDDPTKYWKYNPADVDERGYWDEYQAAYAAALTRCSSDALPWYIVPADRKWYRDWAVTKLLNETMGGMGLEYPPADFDIGVERARLHG